jgi:glycosyltransferase involved in cell wall biosynthesis
MKPLVSACIITYNQQDYIAEAIKGALMQELDEPYEIVVSDDCSTDDTPKIIRELAKSDTRIRVIERSKNVGMHLNWLEAINACSGEFIALCEGDDYWTDNQKLAKQLAVLQSDASLSGSFTNADILEFNGQLSRNAYVELNQKKLAANDLLALHYNPVPTCTLMFRKSLFNGFPAAYYQSPFADRILHTLLILKGSYVFLNLSTATYRKNDTGLWSGIKAKKQHQNMIRSLQIIEKLVPLLSQKALVRNSIRKQLDFMLYNYRDEHDYVAYLKTWLKLKAIA